MQFTFRYAEIFCYFVTTRRAFLMVASLIGLAITFSASAALTGGDSSGSRTHSSAGTDANPDQSTLPHWDVAPLLKNRGASSKATTSASANVSWENKAVRSAWHLANDTKRIILAPNGDLITFHALAGRMGGSQSRQALAVERRRRDTLQPAWQVLLPNVYTFTVVDESAADGWIDIVSTTHPVPDPRTIFRRIALSDGSIAIENVVAGGGGGNNYNEPIAGFTGTTFVTRRDAGNGPTLAINAKATGASLGSIAESGSLFSPMLSTGQVIAGNRILDALNLAVLGTLPAGFGQSLLYQVETDGSPYRVAEDGALYMRYQGRAARLALNGALIWQSPTELRAPAPPYPGYTYNVFAMAHAASPATLYVAQLDRYFSGSSQQFASGVTALDTSSGQSIWQFDLMDRLRQPDFNIQGRPEITGASPVGGSDGAVVAGMYGRPTDPNNLRGFLFEFARGSSQPTRVFQGDFLLPCGGSLGVLEGIYSVSADSAGVVGRIGKRNPFKGCTPVGSIVGMGDGVFTMGTSGAPTFSQPAPFRAASGVDPLYLSADGSRVVMGHVSGSGNLAVDILDDDSGRTVASHDIVRGGAEGLVLNAKFFRRAPDILTACSIVLRPRPPAPPGSLGSSVPSDLEIADVNLSSGQVVIRHRVQVGLANTDDAFVEVTHCQADDTAALAITKRQNTVVCSPPGGNCLRLDRAGAAPAVEALATPYAPGDPPITSLQLDSNRTLLVFNEYDYSLQRPYLKAHLVDLRATPALVRTITLGLSNGVFVSIAGRRVGDDYVLVFDEAATNDGHRVGTATLDFASANLESFATAATLAAPYYSMAVPSGPAPLSMAATNYQGGPCRLDVRRAMDLQLERSFNFGVGNVYFCELVSSNSTHAALLVGSPSAPLSLIDVDILTGQAVAYPAEPRSAGYVYFIEEDPEGDVVLSGTSTDELRGPFAFSIDRNQLFRNGFDD